MESNLEELQSKAQEYIFLLLTSSNVGNTISEIRDFVLRVEDQEEREVLLLEFLMVDSKEEMVFRREVAKLVDLLLSSSEDLSKNRIDSLVSWFTDRLADSDNGFYFLFFYFFFLLFFLLFLFFFFSSLLFFFFLFSFFFLFFFVKRKKNWI